MNRVLWIVQSVLALVFLFAGGMKLITPRGGSGCGDAIPRGVPALLWRV